VRHRLNAGLHTSEAEKHRGSRRQGATASGGIVVVAAASWAGDDMEGGGRHGMEEAGGGPAARRWEAAPRLGPARARLVARTVMGWRAPATRRVAAAQRATVARRASVKNGSMWAVVVTVRHAGAGLGL
jgi:hypothetical protein